MDHMELNYNINRFILCGICTKINDIIYVAAVFDSLLNSHAILGAKILAIDKVPIERYIDSLSRVWKTSRRYTVLLELAV